MRYRLRTLFILLALGPPMIAGVWRVWPKMAESPKKPSFDDLIALITATIRPDSWDDIGGPGTIDEFSTRCFVLEPAEDPFGPDPCGCSQAFTPYSENDDDVLPSSSTAAKPDEDPFGLVKQARRASWPQQVVVRCAT